MMKAYEDGRVSTLAAYSYLKDILQTIGRNSTVTPVYGNGTQVSGTAGDASSATDVAGLMDDIIDLVDLGDDSSVTITYPDITGASAALQTDSTDLLAAYSTIKSSVVSFITTNFSSLVYDSAKCQRDIGLILDAARYDWLLGTNFASHVAAYAYLRRTSNKVTGDQKTATLAANEYTRILARAEVAEAVAQGQIDDTVNMVNDIIFGGSNEGSNTQVPDFDNYAAVRMLELNKDFIAQEAMSYVNDFFSDTVTETVASTDALTISDTSWLKQNMEIILLMFIWKTET